MLLTPLGEIKVFYDDKEVEYNVKAVKCDKRCPDLGGRFIIEVHFKPDGREHIISCRIINHVVHPYDDIETGERLELKSFYNENVKLSIGMEGDTGYLFDGTRYSDEYDYDTDYLSNGVEYDVLETTKTEIYRFGIAWIEPYSEENDIQTWFGADITMMPADI